MWASLCVKCEINFKLFVRLQVVVNKDTDRRGGEIEASSRARAFFSLPCCCLDSWFSEPLRAKLTCYEDLSTVDMRLMFQRVAYHYYKTTNMHLEQLLSEIKTAVPLGKKSANAEKEAFLAHLKMIIKHHVRIGRRDIRSPVSRASLIDSGVLLEHQPVPTWTRKDVRWRNVQLVQWGALHPDASAAEVSVETARLCTLWAAMQIDERDAAIAALDAENHVAMRLPRRAKHRHQSQPQ